MADRPARRGLDPSGEEAGWGSPMPAEYGSLTAFLPPLEETPADESRVAERRPGSRRGAPGTDPDRAGGRGEEAHGRMAPQPRRRRHRVPMDRRRPGTAAPCPTRVVRQRKPGAVRLDRAPECRPRAMAGLERRWSCRCGPGTRDPPGRPTGLDAPGSGFPHRARAGPARGASKAEATGRPAAVGAVQSYRPPSERLDRGQGVVRLLRAVLDGGGRGLGHAVVRRGRARCDPVDREVDSDLLRPEDVHPSPFRGGCLHVRRRAVLAIVGTFGNILAALMYNLISDLVGGIRFQVVDDAK